MNGAFKFRLAMAIVSRCSRRDGPLERTDLSTDQRMCPETVDPLIPRTDLIVYAVLDAQSCLSRDWHDSDIGLRVIASTLEERCELVDYFIISARQKVNCWVSRYEVICPSPRLIPLHCRFVHLVDGDDQPRYTSSLHQHNVLSSLSTLVETSFKLSLSRRDDKNRNICLSSSRNHSWDKRLVPWGIKNCVTSLVCLEIGSTDFNGLSLVTLLGCTIQCV